MKLLAIKDDTVYPWNLRIVVALANVADQAQAASVQGEVALPFEITAGMDGRHSRKSRHYLLAALDVRSKDMTPEGKSWMRGALRDELGPEYEVLLEGDGTPNEHFHIEWDPK